MNSFERASLVECQALARLLPLLQDGSYEGNRLVLTSKGRLARELQREVGDVVRNRIDDGNTIESIEIKAEKENRTGNLFLETWSNRRRRTTGWMYHCKADWLLYYFVLSDECYAVRLPRLQAWAFDERRIYQFPEREQQKYDQLNDTWGACVPITTLMRECGLKRVSLPPIEAGEAA